MTAVGFLFVVLGWVLFKTSDAAKLSVKEVLENLGAACVILGFVLLVAGTAVWLWQVMP